MNEENKQIIASDLDSMSDYKLESMTALDILVDSNALSDNIHKIPNYLFYGEVLKTALEYEFDEDDNMIQDSVGTVQIKTNVWYGVSEEEFEKVVIESQFSEYNVLNPYYNDILDTKIVYKEVHYTVHKENVTARDEYLHNSNKETYDKCVKSYYDILYVIDTYIEMLEERISDMLFGANVSMYNSKIEEFYSYRLKMIDELDQIVDITQSFGVNVDDDGWSIK